ncbi:MAG: diphosphomevalonate decarboxylase [Pseudobdellovibrionaceae bacterium]
MQNSLVVEASAPSNIALIKYMGKIAGTQDNTPTNASFSYTLEHLRTTVRISSLDGATDSSKSVAEPIAELATELTTDQWRSLSADFQLSEKGRNKFLNHLKFLKKTWGLSQNFLVESANNFPSDCGLASSASSFAALTLAAEQMRQKIQQLENKIDFGLTDLQKLSQLSILSRQGSGSSCRSLFSPWALWKDQGAEPVEIQHLPQLLHLVVVVDAGIKNISSSEAHLRVGQSPLFVGRVQRAERRLENLLHHLRQVGEARLSTSISSKKVADESWSAAFQIVWDEFEDMHQLFETSPQTFTYRDQRVYDLLDWCKRQWKTQGQGPLVTMDAGPNIHCLFKPEDLAIYYQWKEHFQKQYPVIGEL